MASPTCWRPVLATRNDPWMLGYLDRVLRSGDVVVDVGASMGVVALLGAKNGCRVLAIEPEQKNFEKLLANIALNDLRCETLRLAITDHSGTGRSSSRSRNGHSSEWGMTTRK